MSRFFKSLLALLLCIAFHSLTAQEAPNPPTEKQRMIEPQDLPADWWKGFETKGDVLQKRIDELLKNSHSAADQLSKEKQAEASSLINDIKLNFQAYAKIVERQLPTVPPPPPLMRHYTISELQGLYRSMHKAETDLNTRKQELANIKTQASTLQDKLGKAATQYSAAGKRSESNTLLGLKVLSIAPALNTEKKKQEFYQVQIQVDTKNLQYLDEEINAAEDRISSSPSELTQFARQIERQNRLRNEAKKERQSVETELSQKYISESTQDAEVSNHSIALRIAEAVTKENEETIHLVNTEILYALSKLFVEPTNVNFALLAESLQDWNTRLSETETLLRQKADEIQQIQNRDSQLLAFEDQKPPPKNEAFIKRLKDNIDSAQKLQISNKVLSEDVSLDRYLIKVVSEKADLSQGEGKRWLRLFLNFLLDSFNATKEIAGKPLFYIGMHPVTLISLINFLLIIIVSWWIAKLITQTLNSIARQRKGIRKAVVYRFNTLLKYFILSIGFLVALSVLGFDFSNLVLVAGALGVGIGFGLQTIFNNFISGIIILFQSDLKVGDFIELGSGLKGEIREINFRSTVLTTNDGLEVIIPNAELISSKIVNWTLRDPYRRIHVPFSVAYGTDVELVQRIVAEAAVKVPCTLKKIGVTEPRVFMTKFGDNALEMELVVWINEKWTRRSHSTLSLYLVAIEKVLKKHSISIPFPQRDVHVKKD